MNSSITLRAAPLEQHLPTDRASNPVPELCYKEPSPTSNLPCAGPQRCLAPKGFTQRAALNISCSPHPASPPGAGTALTEPCMPADRDPCPGALPALPVLVPAAPPMLPEQGGLCQPPGIAQKPQSCCSKRLSKLSVQLPSSTWSRYRSVWVWCHLPRDAKGFLTALLEENMNFTPLWSLYCQLRCFGGNVGAHHE